MTEVFRKIRVEFYFSLIRKNVHAEERLSRARTILTEDGGSIYSTEDTTKKDVRSVIFLAEVPESRFNMHHGFESRLNKSYEKGGCGAGMVTETE